MTLTNYHSSCRTSSEWICKRLSLWSSVHRCACVREGRSQALAVKTHQSLLLFLIVCDTHSYNHLLFLSSTPYDYPSHELLLSCQHLLCPFGESAVRGVDLHVPPKCDTRKSAKGGRLAALCASVRAGRQILYLVQSCR